MNATTLQKSLAFIALAAVAACSGPNAASTIPAAASATQTARRPGVERPHVPHLWQTFVGVGDSLTAGYQSDGFLGATNVTSTASAYPGGAVPPGQENGWWALFYQQMTGQSATSVMPLIAGPGLGNQLVLNATTLLAS
ncbi:MAG TPA: hypothetical protein VMF61_06835, partial [Candidatus Acidoferrales bacterium]|nr:hypothetical protein [Candidatus Acidoferrales bacterium]